MNKMTSKQGAGFIIAAMVFLFALSTTAQAAVKKPNLTNLLKSNGITFKIAKLDRTDGFLFGLTFKGKKIPSITIAPGLDRMLLVQVNGEDVILQGDGTGKMQIIQATGDISVALCYINAVIDFLTGLQTCQNDPACLFTEIVSLITSITTCAAGPTTPAGLF
jgi:hypothetical protein